MIILMLSGYLQSGKDTVADYLVENYNYKRLAFADILKDQVSELYNISRDILDTTEGKNKIHPTDSKGRTNRQILIDHGQEKRAQDPNYWVDKVIEKITSSPASLSLSLPEARYVISDWRFENEFKRIQSRISKWTKLYTVRISRYDQAEIQDISETSLDDFDFNYVIQNRETLEKLYKQIDTLMFILDVF